MIESLKLENIQSHKNTEITFDKGINCIVGSTDKGKSAVIRGLLWAVENRPLGIEKLGSHWIFNDKNRQVEPMSVTVVKDGKVLIRRRTKDSNQYIVNGKELNVVKSDVPEEVSGFFRLSETNIQKQLDSPFLLSNTSGETARYFNSMVKLDIIDRVLSDVESEKRKLRNTMEMCREQIDELSRKLERFFPTDVAEALISSYDRLSDKISLVKSDKDMLKKNVDMAESILNINAYRCIDAETLADEFDGVWKAGERLRDEISSAMRNLREYERCKASGINIADAEKLVIDAEDIKRDLEKKIDEIEHLSEEVRYLSSILSSVEEYDREISDRIKELPDICPVCGKPMEKAECVCREENR